MSKNSQVLDQKPLNSSVDNTAPLNSGARIAEIDILYAQVLTAGMYMGIPPFTYPEAGTVQSPFSP